MNPDAIPQLIRLWLMVNLGGMVVIAVMSYVSSVLVLDWLESLDRWMYAVRYKHKRGENLVNENQHAPAMLVRKIGKAQVADRKG